MCEGTGAIEYKDDDSKEPFDSESEPAPGTSPQQQQAEESDSAKMVLDKANAGDTANASTPNNPSSKPSPSSINDATLILGADVLDASFPGLMKSLAARGGTLSVDAKMKDEVLIPNNNSLEVSVMVAPPSLARRVPLNRASPLPPGAYAAYPGSNLVRSMVASFQSLGLRGETDSSLRDSEGDNESSPRDVESNHHDHNNHDGLAVANLVTDDDDAMNATGADLPLAKEHNTVRAKADAVARRSEEGRQKRCFVASCVVVVVGAILLLVFLLRMDSSSAAAATTTDDLSSDNSNTPTPLTLEDRVFDLIPDYSKTALLRPSSYQSNAYSWLLADPSLGNYPDWRILQRYALAAVYFATGGAHWNNAANWLDNHQHHECQWYTLQNEIGHMADEWLDIAIANPCEEDPINSTTTPGEITFQTGQYKHLWLGLNNLKGKIPPELTLLSSMRTLSLHGNALTGPLPTQLATLTHLEALSVGANKLTGTLPQWITSLSNLSALLFLTNQFSGTIPTEYGQLSKMRQIYFDQNMLTGTLPSELGKLTRLNWMIAYSNNFDASGIPTEWGMLTDLTGWILPGCELTGHIPSELGKLSRLQQFSLDDNKLSGTIPKELAQVHQRTSGSLSMNKNQLTGQIPSEFGSYHLPITPNLDPRFATRSRIHLGDNRLSGTIPTELSGIGATWLVLSNNALTGSMPTEFGLMTNMRRLNLQGNQMTGQLSSQLGTLANLTTLSLGSNAFNGSIPTEFGMLTALETLNMTGNTGLFGTIPASLCSLNDTLGFDCEPSSGLCGCSCDCSAVVDPLSDNSTSTGTNITISTMQGDA